MIGGENSERREARSMKQQMIRDKVEKREPPGWVGIDVDEM